MLITGNENYKIFILEIPQKIVKTAAEGNEEVALKNLQKITKI